MGSLNSISTQFKIKMRHFCAVFYNIDIKEFEQKSEEELDKFISLFIYDLSKEFAQTQEFLGKEDKEYDTYIKNRVRDVKKWIINTEKFKNNSFSKNFKNTNFYDKYAIYFPKKFGADAFFDNFNSLLFISMLDTIKTNYESVSNKRNEYMDFRYITFYSTRVKKLIKYKIQYITKDKVKLIPLQTNHSKQYKETYEGEVEIVNNTFIINAKNDKIYITLVFLLSNLNSFSNEFLLGITVGVSEQGENLIQLTKKVLLSKKEEINNSQNTNSLLNLFLNEKQSLRIGVEDLNDLNSISRNAKTEANYQRLLKSLSGQMKDNKALLQDSLYVNVENDDSFYIPLIESYNILESNIGRIVDEEQLYYRISMSMVDVFKVITRNKNSFSTLKESKNFRIDISMDLTKYKHNIYFNSPRTFLRIFSKIRDLIKSNKFSLTLIIEDTEEVNTLQLKLIPEYLRQHTYYVSKADIIKKNKGYNPLDTTTTVFVRFGNSLVLTKPNTQEFIYTNIDRGKRGIEEVNNSLDTLKFYREKYVNLYS